eukprot:3134338-Rhodomonas_salina.1
MAGQVESRQQPQRPLPVLPRLLSALRASSLLCATPIGCRAPPQLCAVSCWHTLLCCVFAMSCAALTSPILLQVETTTRTPRST